MAQPTVQYFNMGACEDGAPGNEWRTADDFPLPNAVETAYILHAGETVNTGIGHRNSFATGHGELGCSGSQAVRSKGMLSTVGDSRTGVKPKAADLVHATQWRSGALLSNASHNIGQLFWYPKRLASHTCRPKQTSVAWRSRWICSRCKRSASI